MKTYLLLCHLLAFGLLLHCQPASQDGNPAQGPSGGGSPATPATESTTAGQTETILQPYALAILEQMSDYLRSAQQFAFHAEGHDEEVIEDLGQKLHVGTSVDFVVRRPNRIWVNFRDDFTHKRFFLTTLAVTAVVVSVANSNKQYHYDQGVYYEKSTQSDGTAGYVAVQAPIGAKVPTLPPGNTPVTVAGGQTFLLYYYAGVFYAQDTDKLYYVVVQAPAGATVPALPDGATTEHVSGAIQYVYGGVYYEPIFVNGQTMYAVVSA